MGRRADQKDETRLRIVDAAVGLYLERGMAGTSLLRVARAADVAPGTVRNHFPNTTALALAVGEAALGDMILPGPEIFEGSRTLEERLRRLWSEMEIVIHRGNKWWSVIQREPKLYELWTPYSTRYEVQADRLTRAAIAPLDNDPVAVAVIRNMTTGTTIYWELVGRGVPPPEASEVLIQLVLPWLEARLASG
jgi:AcrR family transcriptional regulator